jgi:transcriptional regulator with XRE-family HTH domain
VAGVADLGDRVREARKRRGLTQRELATASGVSVSLVRKLEQGDYGGLRLETAHRLAVALDVTTSALISPRGDAEDEPGSAGEWEPVARAVRGDHDGEPDDEPGIGGGPADQAIELAAGDARDELTMLAAADGKCFVLLRQGRLAECADTAADYAGRCEPAMTAGPEDLAVWGRLMLKAAGAAARDNRPEDARDALRLARMAAAGVGREIAPCNPWLVFGPVTVAMMGAEIAAIQGRPDAVLVIGSQIAGRPYPVPRNYLRHRLDVAHAHVQMRRYAEAVGVLAQARSAAPEWVAQQRYARDILSAVITHSRQLTSQARELADFMHMPM